MTKYTGEYEILNRADEFILKSGHSVDIRVFIRQAMKKIQQLEEAYSNACYEIDNVRDLESWDRYNT